MPEHELGVTKLFNEFLAGPANAILNAAGQSSADPAHPWSNWMVMQVLVFLIFLVGAAVLKAGLSMDRPGGLQHLSEILYGFVRDTSEEIIGHDGPKYLHFFATLFFFILIANLIGIIPVFESPTMFPQVTLGCAVLAFLYYNLQGVKAQGLWGHLKHFAGPILFLAPLMIPIEIVGHLARPMSLTIRLYANMFAGEEVTLVFLGLVPLLVPVIFMALHIFVSFLQAYIFTLLTMVYVGGAVEHAEEGGH